MVILAADTLENGWLSIIYVLIWVNGCVHFSGMPKFGFSNSCSHLQGKQEMSQKKGKAQPPSPPQNRIE